MKIKSGVCGALILLSGSCHSFEVDTHGWITVYAHNNAATSSVDLWRNLGIDYYAFKDFANPFGRQYFHLENQPLGIPQSLRITKVYEQRHMPADVSLNFFKDVDHNSVAGWLVRGAIREDDHPLNKTFDAYYEDDNPETALVRVFGHFFEPLHNKTLTLGGATNGTTILGTTRAPDWAIGVVDAFATPNVPNGLRRNSYSLLDAREAMWRALTLKDDAGNDVVLYGELNREAVRKAYWATTFRALGGVTHILQDMAQPQHARNEGHMGLGANWFQNQVGHGSFMEIYTNTRATRDAGFTIDVGQGETAITVGSAPDLVLGGYSMTPTFERYVDYFSTSLLSSTQVGYGLADYGNRRFFTQQKNLGRSDFPSPVNLESSYIPCTRPATNWRGGPLRSGVVVKMLCGDVVDELDPSATALNVPVTAKSAWNEALNMKGATGEFVLNREVLNAQVDLLAPRAVAYTRGILNHFFRGRIEIERPTVGLYSVVDHAAIPADVGWTGEKGFKSVKVRLKNATPPITPPGAQASIQQTMGPGKVVAVVKYRRNFCYSARLDDSRLRAASVDARFNDCRKDNNGEEITVSAVKENVTIGTGLSEDIEFVFAKEIPINATDVYLQIVFRGKLGSEEGAVVVATKDLSEPSYVSFFNSNDYIFIDGRYVTRQDLAGDASLLALVQPRSCVDSQGQLVASCFQPPPSLAVSLSLSGQGGATAISTQTLPIGRFFRFAYLTEGDGIDTFNLSGDCVSGAQAIPFLSAAQQLDAVAVGQMNKSFSGVEAVRGVYGTNAYNCVLRGGAQPPPLNFIAGLGAATDLDPLPVNVVW